MSSEEGDLKNDVVTSENHNDQIESNPASEVPLNEEESTPENTEDAEEDSTPQDDNPSENIDATSLNNEERLSIESEAGGDLTNTNNQEGIAENEDKIKTGNAVKKDDSIEGEVSNVPDDNATSDTTENTLSEKTDVDNGDQPTEQVNPGEISIENDSDKVVNETSADVVETATDGKEPVIDVPNEENAEPNNESPVESTEPKTETPVESTEPKNETPAENAEPKTETPVESTDLKTETPLENAEPKNETPEENAKLKNETPVESAEPVNETSVEKSEPVNETPVESTEPKNETPVESTEPVNETPVENAEPVNETPVEITEPKNESEVKKESESEPELPVFIYDNDELVSKPTCTEDLPSNFLSLYHSFGFECTKRSNLHILSTDHIIFSTGNMSQILNLKTKQQINLRSTSGGGIGAIAVHPSRKYFAVSEKGVKPNIIIYDYPSLKIVRVLREGTEEAYANLDFSPNGDKLASIGSYPDYMLTIWDWQVEQIVLRSKAFSQDVFKVAFSPEDEGHLCSSGTGHVKFWSMAKTFTGLKLQGQLGRFGTTELSDISGFVELPDGKVLSGSEWGNMLLWDGGLIKVEISRKGKKTCHQGNIEQFFLDEGELITAGTDGYVKVWDFESIDTAEAHDQSKLFELEPMSELKVGNGVKIISLVKSVDEEDSTLWYAQDAAGGIWKLDLSFSHTSQSPDKLFSYHAGKIAALALSPITHIAATTGADGTVRLFDYISKSPLCYERYKNAGCSLLWVPKNVDESCSSVLVGFADGIVRLLVMKKSEGGSSSTRLGKSNVALHLTQVMKPHLQPVTCLAIDAKGTVLATGSDDGTIFFFSIKKMKFQPIGFVKIDVELSSLEWTPVTMGTKLLATVKDGTIKEFSKPAGEYDTSKSFELPIEKLQLNHYNFKTIKQKLLDEEEEARKKLEEAEAAKLRKKSISKEAENKEVSDEEKQKEKEDAEKQKEEEEEERRKRPVGIQGDVLFGFYRNDTGNFVLSLNGFDVGFLYECKFDQNESNVDGSVKAIKVPSVDNVAITSLCTSKNMNYLAFGLDNGSVLIQNIKSTNLDSLNSYWSVPVHDNIYGSVSDIAISYDNKFLISTGNDGNMFVYTFLDEKELKNWRDNYKSIVNLKDMSSNPVDDIDDPKHYSIELEKQKSEQDKMMQLAEEKKQRIKITVGKLRREFRKLKGRNGELPPYLQLPTHEFIIDPQMKVDLQKDTEEKLVLLHKEKAFESGRHAVALEKLQKRFKDTIHFDRITLFSFLSEHVISSYRLTKLTEDFHELVKENFRRMTMKEAEGPLLGLGHRRASLNARGKRFGSSDADKADFIAIQRKVQPPTAQKLEGKIAKMIEKAEERKLKRLNRQKEWEDLYKNKPDENYEDPEDVAGIQIAEISIGDFKLKTAADFVVPVEQRMNAERKRNQLLELVQTGHHLKENFNKKLVTLRDKKMTIIEEIKKLIVDLEDVQGRLPEDNHVNIPNTPEMKPEEFPESHTTYTKEALITFRKDVLGLETLTSTTSEEAIVNNVAASVLQENTHSKTRSTRGATTDPRRHSTSLLSTYSSVQNSSSSFRCESPVLEEGDDSKSKLESDIQEEEIIRLTFRRDQLLDTINEKLLLFDAELRLLRHEKIQLDVSIKNGDLREIVLFEELILLKDFEKRESQLASKVAQKMQEKEEMEDKLDECQESVDNKKAEFEKLQEHEKSLFQTFLDTIGENKFEAFLTKVFRKKIKRTKKSQAVDEEEESDEEESDDDYGSSSDEESDEEEMDDSVCPPTCDPVVFDQICVLREKRMDLEEALLETKKACDTTKKELDTFAKKLKVIDTALKNAGSDVEAFQREKQQKLNELDVVVTLRLDQIQYMVNKTIPQDLSKCLVFDRNFLAKLQTRIKELEREKVKQKHQYRERRQQHVQMIRDKKTMDLKIKELEEKVEQIQMLKFGRRVDLEKLETVSVNRLAEELKEKLREQELMNAKEIVKWDETIDNLQSDLTTLIRYNTKQLDTYTVFHAENQKLGVQLDSRQKNLGSEFQGNRKTDVEERQRLVELVQVQAQEIEALKAEICVLSRKGGHVMPPPRTLAPKHGTGIVQ